MAEMVAPRRLLLLRHAKSSWSDPALRDVDRPLAARGRAAAPVTAAWMRDHGLMPDLVVCSPAARTRETWALVASVLGSPVLGYRVSGAPVRWEEAVYEAPWRRLLDVLRRAEPEAATVLLVGHNPGMEQLAARLAGRGSDAEARSRMVRKFPTAALAVLEFDGGARGWSALEPESGRLTAFVRPRDLGADQVQKRAVPE